MSSQIESDEDLQTRGTSCVDAWVIIGGDKPSHGEAALILATTEFVYDTLLACGYTDEDIYYLVPDYSYASAPRADGKTSSSLIGSVLSVWAPQKVSSTGVLGVYLCDHGGYNGFCIYPDPPDDAYGDWELDHDIDLAEAGMGTSRTIVIYDACTAGSFMDQLSEEDRIAIMSTDDQHSAFFSPIAPYRAMFSDGFWAAIAAGKSIGEAFEDATADVIALGYGQKQFPTIDDNHDDIAHIVNAWGCLPSTGDGNDALNSYIATGCPSFIPLLLPKFLQIPLKVWVTFTPGLLTLPVSVQVFNQTPISKVTCRVVPSDWAPPDPAVNESGGPDPIEALYQWSLSYMGNGNFSGMVEILSPVNNSDYRLSFIVEDINGHRGRILSSSVGLNGDGNPPPDTTNPDVWITNPLSDETVSGTVDIIAKGADDQQLDQIKIYFDGTIVNTTSMPDFLPYPNAIFTCDTTTYPDGIYNITAVATDATGNTNITSHLITIKNQGIPSFQFTMVIIGCFLVILTVHTLRKKKLTFLE